MMRTHLIILASLVPALLSAASGIDVVPLPVEITPGEGVFSIDANTTITASGDAEPAAATIAPNLRAATGHPLPIGPGGSVRMSIDVSLEATLGREGYQLVVTPTGIRLSAPRPAGIFYGGQTLVQLLPTDGSPTVIPAVTIRDRPGFPWRGVMLDVSRYFLTKDYVMRYLDMMAMHKLNVLHWHLIDDPGWRIEIRKYPKLTEIGAFRGEGDSRHGGFYTQDDIREIVRHASARNITIVPEVEIPAHTLAALVAYPYLGCTGKQFTVPTRHSISPELYCAGKETTWTFLEDVFTEVCELFPGTYIHIGGDEAKYQRWKNCVDCQDRMKSLNLNSERQLQGWMTTRIETFLATKNRRIIGWDEILHCGVTHKAGIMTWHRPKTAVEGAKTGNPVVMALTGHAYFDTAQSKLPGEPPTATWLPPISLQKAYEWHPVPDGLTGEAARNILGANACVWTDQFMHKAHILADKPGQGTSASEAYVDYLSLPRLAALAEVAWTPRGQRHFDQFANRMTRMYSRYQTAGYNFRMPTPRLDIQRQADGSHQVTATSPIEGGQVRYTLDGSDPQASSAELTGTLVVPAGKEFRTATFTAGGAKRSLVYTHADASRKHADFGTRIGSWKAGQPGSGKPKTMTFDAAGHIGKNGTYIVTFVYTGGEHRLDIDGIQVVKNDTTVVAQDIHHGFTGGKAKDNQYKITIERFETGASFKIKAAVYGDIGNDTNGLVFIRAGN